MEKKQTAVKRMATPTFLVGAKDYESLAYARITQYVVHGRRGLKLVPEVAQEIGENQVIFPGCPKSIIFRKRFSRKKVERKVRTITADNSERYDLKFFVNLKP